MPLDRHRPVHGRDHLPALPQQLAALHRRLRVLDARGRPGEHGAGHLRGRAAARQVLPLPGRGDGVRAAEGARRLRQVRDLPEDGPRGPARGDRQGPGQRRPAGDRHRRQPRAPARRRRQQQHRAGPDRGRAVIFLFCSLSDLTRIRISQMRNLRDSLASSSIISASQRYSPLLNPFKCWQLQEARLRPRLPAGEARRAPGRPQRQVRRPPVRQVHPREDLRHQGVAVQQQARGVRGRVPRHPRRHREVPHQHREPRLTPSSFTF